MSFSPLELDAFDRMNERRHDMNEFLHHHPEYRMVKAPNPQPDYDALLASRGLPPVAYADNSKGINGPAPVIAIKRGESGFYPIFTPLSADELNAMNSVSPEQREAMVFGSMFGWEAPAANPNSALVKASVKA